jgi:probable HAF family extracellular repeat protein
MSDIGTLCGNSWAKGINNDGQIVGHSLNTSNETHAFLFAGEAMQDLGAFGDSSISISQANRINDNGQIVGFSYASSASDFHAFLYSSSKMTDLGTLGGRSSEASGINNKGQVVGHSYTTAGIEHAFLYDNGTMRDIGTLGGSWTAASDINDNGQIVGYSNKDTTSGEQHAFIYSSSGGMQDLNNLLAPSSGWTVSFAAAINNKGQIVGNGTNAVGQSHALLLTPVFSKFSQNDSRWADEPLANGPLTIGDYGCAVSSLAMAITGAGIAQDPGTLNSLLEATGGFNKESAIIWEGAVNAVAGAAGTPGIKFNPVRSADLDSTLEQGYPVIVRVSANNRSHFVVVTRKEGNTYSIVDPFYPTDDENHTTLDAYNNHFEIRGYVGYPTEKPSGTYSIADSDYSDRKALGPYNGQFEAHTHAADPIDVSGIVLSVVAPGSGVNLLLTDFDGNKTGIDGSGGRFELIPDAVHFIDSIAPLDDAGQPPTDIAQYIQVDYPTSGTYEVEVRGIDADLTPYNLIEIAFAPDGRQLWRHEISGVVGLGSTDQYAFTYTAPEPSSVTLLGIGGMLLLVHAGRRRFLLGRCRFCKRE